MVLLLKFSWLLWCSLVGNHCDIEVWSLRDYLYDTMVWFYFSSLAGYYGVVLVGNHCDIEVWLLIDNLHDTMVWLTPEV